MQRLDLNQADSRFEALAKSAPDAILTIDDESTILSANPAVERIFGYAPSELVGRSLTTLIPERLRPAHVAGIARYLRTGRRNIPWTGVQLPALTKDGREIPVEISFGQFVGDDDTRVFSGFVRDISERVRYEQELEAAHAATKRALEIERRAREDAERARQALAEHQATLSRLNAELEDRAREERGLRSLAQSITGAVRVAEVMHQIAEGALSVSEAAGAHVEQVVSTEGVSAEVEVVAAAGALSPPVGQRVPYPGSLTEEIIARREPVFCTRMEKVGAAMAPYLDKYCHACSVLVVPLLGEESVLGALVLLRRPDEPRFEHGIVNRVRTLGDLASLSLQRLVALAESERRRAEAEAAVRSRDEVLSVVSHDLRNPVSTVAMSAALLQDPTVVLSEAERREQLDVIARSAQRMNRLIQDLLDVARIEGGRLTISCRCEDAAALAAEACQAFQAIAGEKSLTLDCYAERDLRPVYVDRDRVLQVLSNYLNNAVKFTPAGGCIAIRVTRSDEGGVRFAVSDTGPGIAPEDLPHVFSPFWQAERTAHLGSGLGLTIAKGIAQAHDGRVWAEATPGSGSTFFFAVSHSDACT
jgi:PAS domain S-box-containing protein